jgi:LuxR family quorum sensing-dependent transcriptional regulator
MSGARFEPSAGSKPGLHLLALYAFERVRELRAPRATEKPLLTTREREVLVRAAQGSTAWEIGDMLGISKRTVDEHSQSACRKLGAVNRTQAVAIALRDGLLEL